MDSAWKIEARRLRKHRNPSLRLSTIRCSNFHLIQLITLVGIASFAGGTACLAFIGSATAGFFYWKPSIMLSTMDWRAVKKQMENMSVFVRTTLGMPIILWDVSFSNSHDILIITHILGVSILHFVTLIILHNFHWVPWNDFAFTISTFILCRNEPLSRARRKRMEELAA